MFTYTKTGMDGTRATGRLYLNGKGYSAVSGGYGQGELPNGLYHVNVRGAVAGSHLAAGFKAGGAGFFIPIEHNTDASRSGLGIHPDGNDPGTLGCIGIAASDAKRFLDQWTAMAVSRRPTSLEVMG
jgi:hypothetical protein